MSNLSQAKLVFDIETIGVKFEELDQLSQEYILQYAENKEEEEAAKEQLGFSPLTGEVAAIGVLNPETNKGAIYLRIDGQKPIIGGLELGEGIAVETGNEKEIIEKFWDTAQSYNYFVSFNGRAFDAPFLMIRSAILGVRPSKNLMSNRYLESQRFGATHIDLLDQLTFYGTVRRKFNLHMWSRALGVKSPKEQGISGYDVGRLYQEGKLLEIAKYNLEDLRATAEIYVKWMKYLNL